MGAHYSVTDRVPFLCVCVQVYATVHVCALVWPCGCGCGWQGSSVTVKVDPRLNMYHSVPCNWGRDAVTSSVTPPPTVCVVSFFFDVTLKCIGSFESLSLMGVEWGCM